MCEIFSCLVTQVGNGYYDNKVHSHSEIQQMFVEKDPMLKDDKLPPTFARVEIVPENKSIVFPDKWVLKVDEKEVPTWFKKRHEEKAWSMHEKWLEWLYSEMDVSKFPKNPFLQKPDLNKIKKPSPVGDSVLESVLDSVGESVRASVLASVRASVGASVWDSVWASVWASVRRQIGYMFPKCSLWTNGTYKYQNDVDMWQAGIVPVYYQGQWHYFASPNGDGNVEEVKE